MANNNRYLRERLEKIITEFVLNKKLNVFNISDNETKTIIDRFRTKGVKGSKETTQEERKKQIDELSDDYFKKEINNIIHERQGFKYFWRLHKNDFLNLLKKFFEDNENRSIYSWNIANLFLDDSDLKTIIGSGYDSRMSNWFTNKPDVEEGDKPGNKQIYNLISDIRKKFRDSVTDNPNVGYIVAASDVYDFKDDFPKANGWKYTENSEEIDIFCKKQEIKSAKAFLGNIMFLIKKGLVNGEFNIPVEMLSNFIDEINKELSLKGA
ncbi:hypothetical protein [Mesoplasma whartonense]|uniref:hypothetical protein n=1 Tax=Mesoplasma whartonense TaxID=2878854 RepID=UPI002022B37F|nr:MULTISPECIES: hypothetical protein [unclassified Mesoplasma]MCL8212479.1 hypothetical protein [Mesoplasma sp. JKS002661]MCL8215901.1 hypothetical protein [Mesoplasma sp. JKS002657]